MADLYEVEVEPEVRSWLESLTDRDFGRGAETGEVDRAARAQRTCEDTHGIAHDVYEREGT
ncbi:MAG: hypothetical protein ACRDNS_04520 [Trebonia sp.]